jgi:hypothetical protein
VEAVEAGRADLIVVAYFERLVRSLRVQHEVVDRVEAAKGDVHALDAGQITNGNATRALQAGILGLMAEFQARQTAEKLGETQREAVARGIAPWPKVPVGYRRGPDRRYAQDPTLAPVVREMFERRARGEGRNGLRKLLADRGVKRTFGGVDVILGSRVYLGEIHFGELVNLEAHEPIVDRALFDKVQRVTMPRDMPFKPSDRLLARLGILHCENCGSRLVIGHDGKYTVYRCPRNGKGGEQCKARVSISAPTAEDVVIEYVRRAIGGVRGEASSSTGVAACKRALEEAQGVFDSAVQAFADFTDEPSVHAKLDGLAEQRDAARDRYEQAAAADEDARVIVTANEWDELTLDERRRLIRAVIERVEVRRGGRGVERLTVVPKGFDVKPIRQLIPANWADQSTRNAPQGARR